MSLSWVAPVGEEAIKISAFQLRIVIENLSLVIGIPYLRRATVFCRLWPPQWTFQDAAKLDDK